MVTITITSTIITATMMIITMEAGQLQCCRVAVWSGLVYHGYNVINIFSVARHSILHTRQSMCGEEIRRSFFAVRIGTNARLEAKSF